MLSGALALAATNAPATRRGERSSRGHDGLTLCPGFPPEPPTTTCDLLFGILFFYNLLLLLLRLLFLLFRLLFLLFRLRGFTCVRLAIAIATVARLVFF